MKRWQQWKQENIKIQVTKEGVEKFILLKEDANVEPSSSIINSVWSIKDLVDLEDAKMDAWFEGEIQKIDADENNEIR